MRDRVSDQRQTESGQEKMTDYAELLATKSAELAELTKAFNAKEYVLAETLCRDLSADFAMLALIARNLRGV